jgi:biopolymer transport protein ExbD
MFYNEENVDIQELKERLEEDYSDPGQVVRISAEDVVALQQIINLMDTIRNAGYEKIFVATGVDEK